MAKKKGRHIPEMIKCMFFILICLIVGVIGALFTSTGPNSWYSNLVKPSFNPPNWIFGPVWTVLYIMMGIALYLAVKNNVSTNSIKIFAIQLLLNLLWTILFFGIEKLLLSALEILVMLGFILWTIKVFYKKSKTAAYLLIPYALWVTFATVLTWAIFILN